MNPLRLLLGFLCLTCALDAVSAPRPSPWESSVVTLEITRKQYDYVQPWTKKTESLQKTAVVIGDRELLTTADFMSDSTLIRIQKGGRGRWYNGKINWVNYHANLALLTSDEAEFWQGLRPAKFADPIPTTGNAQWIRWRNGNLEQRRADINRMEVKRGKLTFVEAMHLDVNLEVAGAGWSEVIAVRNQIVGLSAWMEGNTCTAVPTPLIKPVLEAHRKGQPHEIGFFAFTWTRPENPATAKYLKLEGEPRGALVVDTPALPNVDGQLKPLDLILQVAGYDIDVEGDYRNPTYGRLSIEDLASRGRRAGETVKMKVLRDGQLQEVAYRLPRAEYSIDLVPEAPFDQEPEYLMLGGLVFQPLNDGYMRNWGADWKRKAPFRLAYYDQEKATTERPSLVVLSTVLPDPYNIGYQDYRYLVLDTINSRRISTLNDILEATKNPADGFHTVEFARGEAVRRMVLDAEQLDPATKRVLQRFGIARDRQMAER